MPKITDINDTAAAGLDIPGLCWLRNAIGPRVIKGKTYLIGGPPVISRPREE